MNAVKMFQGFVAYAFAPFSVIYLELFLRLLTDNKLQNGFPFYVLFTISAGFLISAIVAFVGKPVAMRIVMSIFLFFLCFVFILQYFMNQAYDVFMPFETIISEAGNLIANFADIFIETILVGIPQILVLFIPFILYLVLTIRKLSPYEDFTSHSRFYCTVISLCMLVLSTFGSIVTLRLNEKDMAAFHTEYNFDTSSRRLGLISGLSLDLWYGVFGRPFESASFVSVEVPHIPELNTSLQPQATPLPDANASSNSDIIGPGSTPTPTPIIYGYNALDIDFDYLIENEKSEKIKSVHEYVSALEPSKQNPYTGLFEGKNLIIITAEALTKQVIDPVMTPTLYRLAHNGFYFSDFYQPLWGAGTAGGECSILTGLPPLHSGSSTLRATEQNISYTIGNRLMSLGYSSVAFHNGDYEYYNRHLTHTRLGYEEFIAFGSGLHALIGKGHRASDLDMMIGTVPTFIDKQPFSVYYMTYSGHAGYGRGNPMAKRNWDAFPEQFSEMPEPIRAYYACNLELEHAMTFLVSELEKAGIADDTVIVMATDHYPYGLNWNRTTEDGDNSGDEAPRDDTDYLSMLLGGDAKNFLVRDSNALILWSGCLENEYKHFATEISSPVFTLDILPTLLNLFGLEFDSRMFVGRDVFSDAVPLVFWSINRNWKTEAGYYSGNKFTPVLDDIIIPEDYVDIIRTVVNNKISYAGAVYSSNYFNTIYEEDGTVREGVLRKN